MLRGSETAAGLSEDSSAGRSRRPWARTGASQAATSRTAGTACSPEKPYPLQDTGEACRSTAEVRTARSWRTWGRRAGGDTAAHTAAASVEDRCYGHHRPCRHLPCLLALPVCSAQPADGGYSSCRPGMFFDVECHQKVRPSHRQSSCGNHPGASISVVKGRPWVSSTCKFEVRRKLPESKKPARSLIGVARSGKSQGEMRKCKGYYDLLPRKKVN